MKNLIFKIAVLAGTVAAFASCSDTWLMYDTSQKDKLYFKYENYPSLDQYLSTDFSFALLDESVKEVKKTVTVTLLGMPADRDRTFEVRAIHDTTSNYTTGGVQRELIDAIENEDYTIDRLIVPAGSVEGQIDDLIGEINARTARSERVLVTTLTKKMAEDLTAYLTNAGIKVRYMHHDIDTIERMEIIRDLRLGTFDVLVGINLLREGLDLPEVSLVAILDADKEGFLRSETSLIQTIGRAARNADGLVVMYADSITPSMRRAIDETERRRAKQDAFNREHGIVPKTVIKSVRDVIDLSGDKGELPHSQKALSKKERETAIAKLEKEMREASKRLEFEYAAVLRDRIIELRGHG